MCIFTRCRYGKIVAGTVILFVVIQASIILLVLANKLPQLLSDIVGGKSLQGMSNFGARIITGVATIAISSAGVMAISAIAQVSGRASALKAAFESVQAAMAKESDSGGGEDTGSVDLSGGQPSGSDSSCVGSKGFAALFSHVGSMAIYMGSTMDY